MLLTCGLLLLQAAAPAPPPALAARIHELVDGFKGQVFLYAKNLDTGASIGLREDERVRTASTIKLAVMVEAFDRVERGELGWDHPLTLTAASQVGGSGILGEFAPGLRLTLRDAMHLMIVISDNTATNLVIDHLTADAVNARLDALGFPKTRLMRKVMGGGDSKAGADPALKRFGLGVSTPREMATLVEKIERGGVVSKEASAEMIQVLKRQQSHFGIGRTLRDVEIADKTGALDALRSDVAIVYSKSGRIAMAITIDEMPEVDWTVDNPGLLLMSKLSLALVDGLGAGQRP